MDKYKNIEKEIRERWFKDHKATLTQHGDLTVIDWNAGNVFYAVRYVFDGNKVYISGDLGEAIYRLTWRADIHSFDDINIGYFNEKLSAFCDDRWDFNPQRAVTRLKEWIKELKDWSKKYDKEKMKSLIEIAKGCSTVQGWAEIVNEDACNEFISDLDADYWEWIYHIGNETPARLTSYLIGLKMASEQLKVNEK